MHKITAASLVSIVQLDCRTVKYMMAQYNLVTMAHIHVRDKNYNVYISICTETQNMHIFKYSEALGRCSYEIFGTSEDACRWLESNL